MTMVLFWDYYALKADVFHWSYILLKSTVILSSAYMGYQTYLTKSTRPLHEDLYAILFYLYSLYGMVYIDMTYSYSFIEAFTITALVVKQTPVRYVSTSLFGLMLTFVGFYYAQEPTFVAAGESYKPHALTITVLFYAIALSSYVLVTRYQKKVMELNEKFALIGKQSSFLMHEIKNPLNRVVANSINDHSAQIMADIHKDSQKISGIISSIETLIHNPTRLASTFAKFDLNDIKVMLEQDYASYIKSMNIEHDFSDLNGQFYGNKHLLYQLIKNIILNAIEAIGYRKDEISVIKIDVQRTEKKLNLIISNSNSSISGRDLKQIFEPHFTTKSNGSNKGLGLSLGKSIAEAHYGTISAKSQNNLTAFEILLPDYSESAVKV